MVIAGGDSSASSTNTATISNTPEDNAVVDQLRRAPKPLEGQKEGSGAARRAAAFNKVKSLALFSTVGVVGED